MKAVRTMTIRTIANSNIQQHHGKVVITTIEFTREQHHIVQQHLVTTTINKLMDIDRVKFKFQGIFVNGVE